MPYLCRDPHYTFYEVPNLFSHKRNPRVFEGRYVNITRGDDGTLRPNLKRMPVDMSVDNYAFEVFRELRHALKGLVEE